jgi:hypothetical protein
LKRIKIISNPRALEHAMKNLSLIPVAGQRARTMPTSDCFGGAGDSFPWLAGAMLAFESCEVIRLRLAKLAIGGDGSDREACLMVDEKINAMFEAGASVIAGASAATVIGRYREHVAANAKRLSAV